MESIDNLMPALPKTDDPDIQELLSVFRNEFLKHKITQEEFDEYSFDWIFRTEIIQSYRYEGSPPKPTDFYVYSALGKEEKKAISEEKEGHIKELAKNWQKACSRVYSNNIQNLYWLKKFKEIADRLNLPDRVMEIETLLATFPSDYLK